MRNMNEMQADEYNQPVQMGNINSLQGPSESDLRRPGFDEYNQNKIYQGNVAQYMAGVYNPEGIVPLQRNIVPIEQQGILPNEHVEQIPDLAHRIEMIKPQGPQYQGWIAANKKKLMEKYNVNTLSTRELEKNNPEVLDKIRKEYVSSKKREIKKEDKEMVGGTYWDGNKYSQLPIGERKEYGGGGPKKKNENTVETLYDPNSKVFDIYGRGYPNKWDYLNSPLTVGSGSAYLPSQIVGASLGPMDKSRVSTNQKNATLGKSIVKNGRIGTTKTKPSSSNTNVPNTSPSVNTSGYIDPGYATPLTGMGTFNPLLNPTKEGMTSPPSGVYNSTVQGKPVLDNKKSAYNDYLYILPGMASSLAGPLYDLTAKKVTAQDVDYDRISPEMVNYEPAREAQRRNRDMQIAMAHQNAKNLSSGAGMNYNLMANAMAGQNAGNAIDQLYMGEGNFNAGVRGNANAMNAQIQMREEEARAKEKDYADEYNELRKRSGLYNIGNIGQGITRDVNSQRMQDKIVQNWLVTGDYKASADGMFAYFPDGTYVDRMGNWFDRNGNPKGTIKT
jgi:hypothetical protein